MKNVIWLVCGVVLGLCLSVQMGYSATVGYILLEQVQLGLLGVDMNLEADAESLIFDAETNLLTSPSSGGILNHIEYLRSQGHTVHIYGSQTDDALGLDHMEANNDIIIVSENPSSAETGSFYMQSEIPVIICESYVLDDHGLFIDPSSCPCDEDINAREFRVEVPGHPIVEGLPETFAPLDTDPANGMAYVGNWSVLAEGELVRESEKDNVILSLVDPVAPIPQENDYIMSEPVPVLWAFDEGDAPFGNVSKYAFFGWGTENATGIGIADDPLFAGGTAGVYAFDVTGVFGFQLWDRIIDWSLSDGSTPVDHWSIY